MKGRLLILLASLALATGCAAAKPVVMTPVASEPDPWAGFTNGVKAPEPEAKHEDAKPAESKPEAKSAEAQTGKVASAESTDSTEEDVKPVPAKKAGKGKKAKRAGAVAGKKPRKRAKKQG